MGIVLSISTPPMHNLISAIGESTLFSSPEPQGLQRGEGGGGGSKKGLGGLEKDPGIRVGQSPGLEGPGHQQTHAQPYTSHWRIPTALQS